MTKFDAYVARKQEAEAKRFARKLRLARYGKEGKRAPSARDRRAEAEEV